MCISGDHDGLPVNAPRSHLLQRPSFSPLGDPAVSLAALFPSTPEPKYLGNQRCRVLAREARGNVAQHANGTDSDFLEQKGTVAEEQQERTGISIKAVHVLVEDETGLERTSNLETKRAMA